MVTVLFADVVGFTSMSKDSEAAAVMMFLNELYAEFDDLTLDMDVYQLDTVGDAYIVAGGLVERDEDGFQTVVTGRTREQAAQDAMNVFKVSS
jgi:class 3 adenylate cyclase